MVEQEGLHVNWDWDIFQQIWTGREKPQEVLHDLRSCIQIVQITEHPPKSY